MLGPQAWSPPDNEMRRVPGLELKGASIEKFGGISQAILVPSPRCPGTTYPRKPKVYPMQLMGVRVKLMYMYYKM